MWDAPSPQQSDEIESIFRPCAVAANAWTYYTNVVVAVVHACENRIEFATVLLQSGGLSRHGGSHVFN
jgi:hypothetical protein